MTPTKIHGSKRKARFLVWAATGLLVLPFVGLSQALPLPLPTASAQEREFDEKEFEAALAACAGSEEDQRKLAGEVKRRGIGFRIDEAGLRALSERKYADELISALFDAEAARRKAAARALDLKEAETQSEEFWEREDVKRELAGFPLLERARVNVFRSLGELPDLTVVEEIERRWKAGPEAGWAKLDVVKAEASYRKSSGEIVAILSIDGKKTKKKWEDLKGMATIGDFSTLMRAPFNYRSRTKFKKAGSETLRGYRTTKYSFEVPQEGSQYSVELRNSKGSPVRFVAPYRGTVWIDAETSNVVWIEQELWGLPKETMIDVSEEADYGWAHIGERKFWSPLRTQVRMIDRRHLWQASNTVTFGGWRLFVTGIDIGK